MTKRLLCALITDVHVQIDAKKDNRQVIYSAVKQVASFCKANRIRKIFILGDVFKARASQNLLALKAFTNIILMLDEFEVFVIAGNHDKTDQAATDSYIDIYNGNRNLCVVEEYMTVELDNGKCGFHLLPYFPEATIYKDYLEVAKEGAKEYQYNILGSHIAVSGVKNNDGSVVKNSISVGDFADFDIVFMGHYHNRSRINNIVYMGSLIPHNFGEDNEKGFVVLQEEDGEYSFEYKPIKFPKYLSFEFDLSTPEIQTEIDLAVKKYRESEHNIRFVFIGTKEQLSIIDRKKLNEAGIKIKTVNITQAANMMEVAKGQIVSFNKSKIKTYFLKYCKENDVRNVKIGMELLKKGIGDV